MRRVWIQMTWLRGTKWCLVASAGRILTALLLVMGLVFIVMIHSPKVRIPSQQEIHAQTAEQRIRELERLLNGDLQMLEPVGRSMAYRYVVQKELVEGVK